MPPAELLGTSARIGGRGRLVPEMIWVTSLFVAGPMISLEPPAVAAWTLAAA